MSDSAGAATVLRPGDTVSFRVVTDTRNAKRRRAVEVTLVERAKSIAVDAVREDG
jgi:hypothetical protein